MNLYNVLYPPLNLSLTKPIKMQLSFRNESLVNKRTVISIEIIKVLDKTIKTVHIYA